MNDQLLPYRPGRHGWRVALAGCDWATELGGNTDDDDDESV